MSNTSDATIFGCAEYVSMPQFGIRDVIAKIDTGAYSGALHCSRIEEYKRESDGKKVVRFISENSTSTEFEDYKVVRVRSSTGHLEKRYVITTTIQVRDKQYSITIGLANRAKMQREILIGRRFLRENDILVDTRINQNLDMDGGEYI